MILKSFLKISVFLVSLGFLSSAYANNLSVSNVTLGLRNPSAKTLAVSFDLSWNNSWRNKINHDAVWVTFRLSNSQDSESGSKLCQISASGLNPSGSSFGTAANLEIYVPGDQVGAFIRRSANGPLDNVASQSVKLTIDYNSCGFADNDQVTASIFALEMVFIPQGSYFVGDYNTSTASLNKGSSDITPWNIISENAINVTNLANNGFRYVSAGNNGEYATGTTFTIPTTFPKGYNSFYTMKYEISEGQWVSFINSLPSTSRLNRDITDNNHKNSDSTVTRNTISCSGNRLLCSTDRPVRAMTFLTWMDLASFLDWAGLRPMTELEFEKISRGPVLPIQGEYVWGTVDISSANNIDQIENGIEKISTINANANFGNITFSGGDTSNGADHQKGSLRTGIFASNATNRVSSGGAYYGVMELSGNSTERVVTIGNANGLLFNGSNGDGNLSQSLGYEGNANEVTWPGIDTDISKGVTSANGSGFRGGSWLDSADLLRISDRTQAARTSTESGSNFGGRGVRTYDGS